MKNRSLGGLFTATAAAAFLSVTAYAQDTTGTGQTTGARQDGDQVVTVTGCLMAERDVPGRDENLFQRWGLMEQDYVLTHARPQTGAQSSQAGQPGQAGGTGQTGQATGTSGTADRADTGAHGRLSPHTMLKLDGKDADKLRQHANQRVEIRGKIDDGAWFQRASAGGHDRTDRADTTVGTSGTSTTGTTGTDTGTGATGTPTGGTGTGGGTTGAAAAGDDRLASIDVESIRAVGPCQHQ